MTEPQPQTSPPQQINPTENYFFTGQTLLQLAERMAELPYRDAVQVINLLAQARPVAELSKPTPRKPTARKSKV